MTHHSSAWVPTTAGTTDIAAVLGKVHFVNTLSESLDGVIGVDTHRDSLAAAVVSAVGATLASTEATADADGYQRLLNFARRHLPNQRCWAVEGTSS